MTEYRNLSEFGLKRLQESTSAGATFSQIPDLDVAALTPELNYALDLLEQLVSNIAANPVSENFSISKEVQSIVTHILALPNYEMLALPNIVPMSGGGIQLEWQQNDCELELEVRPGSNRISYLKVFADQTMEENEVSVSDEASLHELIDWVAK